MSWEVLLIYEDELLEVIKKLPPKRIHLPSMPTPKARWVALEPCPDSLANRHMPQFLQALNSIENQAHLIL